MTLRFDRVSAAECGDYYQVAFARGGEAEEYLLVQRQFESSDGGRCYIETHDLSPVGHFRVVRATLWPHRLTLECRNGPEIDATFHSIQEGFAELRRVLKIMFPDLKVRESVGS